MLSLLLPLLCLLSLGTVSDADSQWSCSTISNTSLAINVFWTQHNCTGTITSPSKSRVGPIIVNIVHSLLSNSSSSPKLRPTVARTPLGLAKLHELAATASTPNFKPLAGVNGGFFFEVNDKNFFDDVCFGKLRKDALENVSDSNPNFGIGDSLTILDGVYASNNCNKFGNSQPVAAVLDFPPRFVQLQRAGKLPAGVQWAIGAGPNLVSYNASTGTSFIDIEGDNINILEHASNTGLALRGSEFLLVEFDGEDGCTEYKPTCGINSHQFAAFMLDELRVDTAMELDQGGSTAMWIAGQPGSVAGEPGIVSNPGHSERQLFNGLFVGL